MRILSVLKRRLSDGRVILFAGALAFAEIWLYLAAKGQAPKMWSVLHVNWLEPAFADTITVSYSLDAANSGHDPYTYTGIDPWHRTYNYPPLWLLLRHVGVTGAHTVAMGILTALVFFLAFAALLPRLRWWEGAMATAAFFSCAPMLAIERGNIDLIVFAILVLAAFLLSDRRRMAVPFGLFFLAAALKYYPAVCLASYVRWRPGKRAAIAILTGVLIVEYLGLTLDGVRMVTANTPKPAILSYGSAVIFEAFKTSSIVKALGGPFTTSKATLIGDLILLALFAIVALAVHLTRPEPIDIVEAKRPVLHAFGAGVLMYIGSFLLGYNYDYRLSLLLLTMPQLFLWSRAPSLRRWAAWLALVCMLLSLNSWWLDTLKLSLLGELSNWVICVTLFGLYVPTLYGTFRRDVAIAPALRTVSP
jgi:hypothetical protein